MWSSGSTTLLFGLGDDAAIEEIVVDWPSGVVQQLTDIAVDQRLLLREDDVTPTHDDSVDAPLPARTWLEQNAPSPFNPTTRISLSLPARAPVALVIYDVAGRRVRSLMECVADAGRYDVVWNGRDDWGRSLSSGTYSYELRTPSVRLTRSMHLLR